MAFEKINVSSLKKSLNECKNSINYAVSEELIGDISNVNVWQVESQKNLKKSLDTLVNKRYKDLEEKINDYLNLISYIDDYKELEQKNEELQSDYNYYRNRLYYTETYQDTVTDIRGNTKTITRERTVKDYNIQNKMNNIKTKINNNKAKMENLRNKVSNGI